MEFSKNKWLNIALVMLLITTSVIVALLIVKQKPVIGKDGLPTGETRGSLGMSFKSKSKTEPAPAA
jgi:hypothetical protein